MRGLCVHAYILAISFSIITLNVRQSLQFVSTDVRDYDHAIASLIIHLASRLYLI